MTEPPPPPPPHRASRWGPDSTTTTSASYGGSRRSNKRKTSSDDGNDRYKRPSDRGYPNTYHDVSQRAREDGPRDDSYHGRGESWDDDDRSGRYSQRDTDEDRWKCLECRTWNYMDEDRCARCGLRERSPSDRRGRHHGDEESSSRKHQRRHSSDEDRYSYYGRREDAEPRTKHDKDDDLDEFGRGIKALAQMEEEASSKKWPPCFDKDGARYVFDARSGMFYEAMSDFFFDPKTKLYYGNKQKAYYKYCPGQDVPYQELARAQQQASDDVNGATTTLATTKEDKPDEKKKIAICLKTKTLPGGKGGDLMTTAKPDTDANNTTTKAVSRVHKKHAANMVTWSEREREMRGDDAPPTSPGANNGVANVVPAVQSASTADMPASTTERVAKTTKKGQPICLLCKRKFASVDKLQLHEKVSVLHKENVAKKAAADAIIIKSKAAAEQPAAAVEYRDRARERRVMHGPEIGSVGGLMPDDFAATTAPQVVVRPEENLGSSNIGNQMLQKLGWRSGDSLGRKDATSPSQQQQQDAPGGSSLQSTILKDWQKIEAMAGGQQGSRRMNSGSGVGGGIGSSGY